MATQFDPIAKDESLNTTEATPRNIADVLAEELSGIASALTPAQLNSLADVTISSPSDGQTLKYNSVTQKWENANDAGGHIIENPSGTDMTQRANLQFVDAHLTDDSVNDRTGVENIKDIPSADYASATEDGFYNVTDESDEELTAADIAYDSNDSIKEKIDDLDAKVDRGSVSVTADGAKTNSQLYSELHALIDYSKVTKDAVLQIGTQIWTLKTRAATYLTFSRLNTGSTGGNIIELTLSNNPARYAVVFTTAPGISVLDENATVPSNGTVHTLYY